MEAPEELAPHPLADKFEGTKRSIHTASDMKTPAFKRPTFNLDQSGCGLRNKCSTDFDGYRSSNNDVMLRIECNADDRVPM